MVRYSGFETAAAEEVLTWALSEFGESLAISTSFQKEGMVVIDMAARINPKVRVFTIDTGRLPEETHQMIETVRQRYGIPVEIVFPEASEVESMIKAHGPNLFYREVPLRKLCCHIRKVRPLERKMLTLSAWVVGLRRSQMESRSGTKKVESREGIVKISPLADWSKQQVEDYIREHDVPMHPLYAKGFPSIGCGPCTRATFDCEDERAGRWWWEVNEEKECGIHIAPSGQVMRQVDALIAGIAPASGA
ncbi:MAG: phosphoadenylyl-sulfate reductase [Bryobacteraceae bacterium]